MRSTQLLRVIACSLLLLSLVRPIPAHAQVFTNLYTFDGPNGIDPLDYGSLVQGFDGNFYGTTAFGGAHNNGSVFKVSPVGALTTVYSFCAQPNCTDGYFPEAGLAQGGDGSFYGTTSEVPSGFGSMFKVSPVGALTTLYRFCLQSNCPDGAFPVAQLVEGRDGNFYGTTVFGAAYGGGTVFKITPAGALTTLYNFCAQTGCADGYAPYAGLVQGTDGNFYGTTSSGGVNDGGTVFKITPAGALTTLYNFCVGCEDGYNPYAGLTEGLDRNFYGTTYYGGMDSNGTVFKITPLGVLTTLYSFCAQSNCADGANPYAGVVQGTDGRFYGTTYGGGVNGNGTLFKMTPLGVLTTLYSFCAEASCADGALPYAGLLQATNGRFYGVTQQNGQVGCSSGCGTLFDLSVGLGPFVETLPTVGKVGSPVIILGNHLNDTTSVTFNGTAATFTVASPTEIKTTVPTGATSGKVQVTMPSGTLNSNVVFRVQ
jgi:uncharacterized repeat protein (TIGR03803 family)